ncbi:methyl-accepting chemotaxis protein [Clostridium beijerinckii]|uniref:Chemotaxis protein n=2 Tax=Bacteria TaxID=2 RepID=A0A1S9N2Y9_CLOBE|nr:methyl-accepting chemotaxis protein [Clostridium beijerinckii]MZK49205.1 methyl-accepting chemotaxis protein [Clostridium beijerinckii]MZK57036.1 methyl-accepting chemotaxis protein [Clostridium beijerinckii]MZK67247.1 methyl-accepting chemotaxis protein [Clostridium beijerinckii]MZK72873.1 methyl-accepting chemotaxis protein [Clostridium beijerinckii]MZK82470.1 methyl-accepting chemotaxis protein [Clostridium beijerinckii]
MKSIKSNLILCLGVLMGTICIGLGIVSFINSSNALRSSVGTTLPEIAEQTAGRVQATIEGNLDTLESYAVLDVISDMSIPWETKQAILQTESERLGSIRIGIADINGRCINTDGSISNVSGEVYFKKAIAGTMNVSDPFINSVDKRLSIAYAVPVKNGNKVVGALVEIRDGYDLSELTNNVKVGETGKAFMIRKDGTSIANTDNDKVLNMDNSIEAAKTDTSLQALSDIETKMGNGEKGIGEYSYGGADKYIGYAPVEGTEWSVGVLVLKTEMLSELDGLKVSMAVSSIVFLLIGLLVIYFISNNLSKLIKSTSKHLELLAEGNLCEEVSPKNLKIKDEIGYMTNSMKVMQESLGNMIRSIKDNSSNINIQSEKLAAFSEGIASAAGNVTSAIAEIAKGTSTQSNELVNITEMLNAFNDKLSGMVREIEVVDSNARNISSMANDSSNGMNELNQSVTKVSSSFKDFYNKIMGLGININKINEITNIINSIAEQTNLLALNAAIEAARAGEAGKGFAVVADEIRALAEQSKVSSENISKLISGISKDTDVIVQDSVTMDDELVSQANIINNSIVSFEKIITAVSEVIPKIETVKNSAKDIDNDNNDILIRVDGISSISVKISASSQEISAASEEMSASTEEVASFSQMLTNMTNEMINGVDKFKV